MTRVETRTLNVDGAALRYDIRGELHTRGSANRTLVLVGGPMDASGFTTLASYFTDRAVVTYDPRGTGRSVHTNGATEMTPDEHATDLQKVIESLGVDAVDLFGSSGGAVNGLALVATHPEQVRTFVAHEPPTAQFLPDRARVLDVCADIHETYRRSGMGPAMAKFIALTRWDEPLPDDYLQRPPPNPAEFGLPGEDDGSRDDPLLGQNIRTCSGYRHDIGALTAASTRTVIAVGKESYGQLAARGGVTIAERLGIDPVVFPSHHAGFLGGEFGMFGEPDGFADALREALSSS